MVYLAYGIRHSVAGKTSSLQHVPDEQRILLPDDDDHVTDDHVVSRDVTSSAEPRLTATRNLQQRDVNARSTTAYTTVRELRGLCL